MSQSEARQLHIITWLDTYAQIPVQSSVCALDSSCSNARVQGQHIHLEQPLK